VSGVLGVMTPAEFAAEYGLTATSQTPQAPAPQFVQYITGPGARWDTVAWQVYGDPTLVGVLIMANAGVAISPVLAEGLTLYAPVIPPPGPPANSTPWNP
jgi:phage tail protein X